MEEVNDLLTITQPAIYPPIDALPNEKFSYGRNQYSLFHPGHQRILFEALKLRCHTEKQLTSQRYITSTELITNRDKVRVPKGINLSDIITTPLSYYAGGAKRKVIALDCEMVGISFEEGAKDKKCEVSELGQLCVIDVLTGEVLIDSLVNPLQRVTNWRTRYSGLTPSAIRSARSEGRLLQGWRSARAELLKYADSNTILIGHNLQSDLCMLRLAHDLVVDTSIQTAEAVFGHQEKGTRVWGLKAICKELLDINIQVGKRGHDCVEDTLATREITLWCLCNPRELGDVSKLWNYCVQVVDNFSAWSH